MFSPGPWEIIRQDLGDESACIVPVGIRAADGFPVVAYEGGLAPECEWNSELLEANAALIAAAPDMYEALKTLRATAQNMHDALCCEYSRHVVSRRYDALLKQADEALAKAERGGD